MSNFVPKPSTLGALAALQAAKAYKIAQEHAARGVPPEIASKHAVKASDWYYTTLFLVAVPGWFMGLFFWGGNPLWLLWKAAVIYLSWELWKRMKQFVDTDPRFTLKYEVSTTALAVTWTALWTVGLLGGLAYLSTSSSMTY